MPPGLRGEFRSYPHAAGLDGPATVEAELGGAKDWIGRANREDQTLPVLQLRESAQRLGLIRKIKGELALTSAANGCSMIPKAFGFSSPEPLPTGMS